MLISHSVMPPGGWVFTQNKVILIGSTFDLLVENIKSHRKYNGMEPGNPVHEAEAQLAFKHPHLKRVNALA